MPDSEPVVLRTFINVIEAEIAQTALESAGIPSFVRADDCGGLHPHLQLRGTVLLVRAEDRAEAEQLLTSTFDADKEMPEGE
jgi:hypothetical protein